MDLEFSGELWFWRGPSPYHFVTMAEEPSAALESAAPGLSYGWGCIPVTASIGGTTWTTSSFPKDERYIVPVKAAIRAAEHLELGDVVQVRLRISM